MPTYKIAGVSNFQVPKPGSEQIIKLVFTAADNGTPFAFNQTSGSNLPSGFSPQGVIIDARNVKTEFVFLVGGITDFEITVHPGAYASYLIPAFANSEFTVDGMAAGDTCVFYATNFPLVPQQYGLDVSVSLPIPSPTPLLALDYIRINSTGNAYEARTPNQVLSDIGAPTDAVNTNYGQVGSLVVAYFVNSGTFPYGTVFNGATLAITNFTFHGTPQQSYTSSRLSGSWRCLGEIAGTYYISVFVRIA